MIFDLVPNLFASLLSVLFPVFASYKALRTGDPAQLAPWLMYWVTFALLTLAEGYLSLVLFFVPFYATMRLGLLLYLILPQTQGARRVYQTHIDPFLAAHEARIERGIVDAYTRLRALGLDTVLDLLASIQRAVLGGSSSGRPAPPSRVPGPGDGYVAGLLARFTLPAGSTPAAGGAPGAAADFYGLLTSAAASLGRGVTGGATGGAATRDAQIEALGRSGSLVPAHLTDPAERAGFVKAQRERLRVLLGALDHEAAALDAAPPVPVTAARAAGGAAVPRNRSETGFERIDRDEAAPTAAKDDSSGGWLGWAFSGGQQQQHHHHHHHHHNKGEDEAHGTSSGAHPRS